MKYLKWIAGANFNHCYSEASDKTTTNFVRKFHSLQLLLQEIRSKNNQGNCEN